MLIEGKPENRRRHQNRKTAVSCCENRKTDDLLQVFIPRMYYNYRIEIRAYEEPPTILSTSDKRKDGIPPPRMRLSWDSPHPPPESVRSDGRTLTSEPKFLGSTGYQNLFTHGAPRAPL